MIERTWAFLQARFTRADAARLVSSLILATMLWGYVSLITDPEETQTFAGLQIAPLEGLDDNLILTSDLPEVSVRLTGPESVLEDISPDEIELSVDTDEIDGPTEGQDLRIQIETPDGIRRSEANPSFVTVRVAEKATPKEFVLEPIPIAQPESPNLQVRPPQPSVSMVTVSGAAPAVDRVAKVILPVDIGQHTETFEEAFTPIAVDADGTQIPEVDIQPQRVLTTVEIMARGRTVPVLVDTVGQPAPGYQVNTQRTIPLNVTLDGPRDVLESIMYVYTRPVDITNATQDVSASVPIDESKLPEGVTVLSPANGEVQVIVQISLIGSPQNLASQTVQVNGVSPGYSVSLEPSEVSVVVEASTEQIEQLQPGDIAVSVDVTGRESGTYQIRPTVSVPPEMSWIRTEPEFVSVTIVESDAFNGNNVPGLGDGGAAPVSPAASPSPVASPDA
jgi:YbbR domain-containing protein